MFVNSVSTNRVWAQRVCCWLFSFTSEAIKSRSSKDERQGPDLGFITLQDTIQDTSRFDFILYQMDKVSTSPGSDSRIFLIWLGTLILKFQRSEVTKTCLRDPRSWSDHDDSDHDDSDSDHDQIMMWSRRSWSDHTANYFFWISGTWSPRVPPRFGRGKTLHPTGYLHDFRREK